MVLYRVASPFGHGWQWVSNIYGSFQGVYNFCNYQRHSYPEAMVFGTASGNPDLLHAYLMEHLEGHPTVSISLRSLVATQRFNVQILEPSLASWVVKECEEFLYNIQANPFHERDQIRIQRRLEFIKFLVVSGRMDQDGRYEGTEKIPQEIKIGGNTDETT